MLFVIAAIWGASVVADSAQFSSCITELGDPQYIGTAIVCGMTAISCLFYAQLCAWALEVIDLLRKLIDRESTD